MFIQRIQINYEYWKGIFEKGTTSHGVRVLAEPINLMKMIQP